MFGFQRNVYMGQFTSVTVMAALQEYKAGISPSSSPSQPRTVQACARVPNVWSSLSAAGAEIPAVQGRACAWRARTAGQ